MKKFVSRFLFPVALVCLFAVAAEAQQLFVASLSGAQEVPAVTTNGKGTCKLTLNAAQTQISIGCAYSGLSSNVVAGHIHGAAAIGANAPVIFNFSYTGTASGTIGPLNFNVTSTDVANLRSGKWYVNIHTANNGGGEIRGQLHRANNTPDDYDGDGRTDPTVFRPSNGTWYTISSLTNTTNAVQWGSSTDVSARNYDIDGDGRSDFAVGRVDQTNGAVSFFILQSDSNTLLTFQFGNVALGDQLATGDFDGDGRLDIGVLRNGLWIWRSSATGQVNYFQWGQSGDTPIAGDYDGDGISDYAIVRLVSNNLQFFIRQSSNGQLKSASFPITTNVSIPINADYDGDGKADIAYVVLGANLDYYITRSSDNTSQFFRWGVSGDATRTGDFDGDGKNDFCAIRNQSGNLVWYISQSSNAQPRYVYWGLGTDVY
jgi:hypothetical protein